MRAFFSIFASVLLLDVGTKAVVRATMSLGREIPLLPFFSLTHVRNTGIAFGLFQDRNAVLIVIGLAVAAALAVYGLRLLREDRWSAYAIAGVLGGAIGNLFDRIAFGWVTDFLDFYAGPYHWPVFNVADSAICVGAGLLLWRGLRDRS